MKLKWDQTGDRLWETGVDQGVVFPMSGTGYDKGAAWNGLTAVNESPSGAEETELWADNQKYGGLISAEKFGATIEAYTYPDEFAPCDGAVEAVPGVKVNMQTRKAFGFTYRTLIGNDVDDKDHGYIIHLVYGCKAQPSEKSRSTVNDSPDVGTFSWTVTTTPVSMTTIDPNTGKPYKATSHIEINSLKADADKLKDLEDILYGTDGTSSSSTAPASSVAPAAGNGGTDARLPLPDEVFRILGQAG